MNDNGTERFETVVVGGGQAGLAAGYHLGGPGGRSWCWTRTERVGDAWRQAVRLAAAVHARRYDGLPGLALPRRRVGRAPTKDEMADYLEAYAARFDLPVRTGVRVDRISKDGDRFVVSAGDRRFEADNVIVATGAHQRAADPRVRTRARSARSCSCTRARTRTRRSCARGGVLVVGAGNSGGDIAIEVVRTHPHVAGRSRPRRRPVRHRQVARPARRHPHRAVRRPPRADPPDADGPQGDGEVRVAQGAPLIRVKPK